MYESNQKITNNDSISNQIQNALHVAMDAEVAQHLYDDAIEIREVTHAVNYDHDVMAALSQFRSMHEGQIKEFCRVDLYETDESEEFQNVGALTVSNLTDACVLYTAFQMLINSY